MIYLTDKAIEAFKERIEKRNTPDAYIRVGVKGSGCKGFTYAIQFEDNKPREKDLEFFFNGIRVIVDKKSILYLNECTIDFEKTPVAEGFQFINPNEKSRCGCGQSFTAEIKK